MGLHMPMVELADGTLCVTTKQLASALHAKENTISELGRRHRSEFSFLNPTANGVKDFLRSNKVEFGIKKVKHNIVLWTEDDMIIVAMLSKSEVSKQFRKGLVSFIKENATKEYVRRSEYDQIKADLDDLKEFKEMVRQHIPALNYDASLAGKILNNQKNTKHLRLVKGA
jgi:hypothetical protein